MTKKMQHFSLKVLTINIHKGFTAFNRRFILPEIPCKYNRHMIEF